MITYLRSFSFLLFVILLAACGREPSDAPVDVFRSPEATLWVPEDSLSRLLKKASRSSLEGALRKTTEVLAKAKEAYPGDRSLLERMQAQLAAASVKIPKAAGDHKACAENAAVLAFVNLLIPNTIFLCKRAAGANENRLSQVLIHEAAHLAGVEDECEATRVEVAVLRSAKARLPFRNGYMRDCGIR